MTRLQQARHLAITSEYWRAYLDGLDDKHRVRDNAPVPRRESWDSDWAPTPNETGAPQGGSLRSPAPAGTPQNPSPASSAYPKEHL